MQDVASYVVSPGGGGEDTPALLAALEACRTTGAPRLVFRPGRYDFHAGANPNDPNTTLSIADLEHLTVDGAGATLVFHGLVNPFRFVRCRDLRVRNLSIDWERPPFSVGEIVSATDRSFDVLVLDEFPVRGGEPVQAFMDYDPATGRPPADTVECYWGVSHTELVGPQRLRVHLNAPLRMKPGRLVVLRHQVYGFNAVSLVNCASVTIEDVTVYTCPGMGVVADNCRDVTIERLSVLVRPGTRRLMSTTADGTHFYRCGGLVRLHDCVFEAMGDDAGNFKGLYLTADEQADERTVLGAHNLKIPCLPEVGDELEFVRRDTLLTYAARTVAAATHDAGDGRHAVTFTEPLPGDFQPGDVLSNVARMPRVRISGCSVRNNRARGFLLQTRDAVIEDCTFERCTSGGVFVMTEVVYFFESGGTRDVVIRHNRFVDCAYTTIGGAESPITVFGLLADFALPPRPGVHRNVAILGNRIEGGSNSGIFVAGTDGFSIKGNTLTGVCRAPARERSRAAISIMSSAGGEIVDNEIDAARQGPGFGAALLLGAGCEPETIRTDIVDVVGAPSMRPQADQ